MRVIPGLFVLTPWAPFRKGAVSPGRYAWLAILPAILSTLSPSISAATTWHVPGDAPTIQAGIDLAQPGDDVLVAPGTYYEHDIEMKGGVWVHSEDGPDRTFVDGEGASRVFDCSDQAGRTTLEGFTISNGRVSGNTEEGASGGGIRCLSSALTMRACVIDGCASGWWGGGAYILYGDADIEDCEIRACSSEYSYGGMFVVSTGRVRIANCRVLGNQAGSSVGGVAAAGTTVEITGCVISGNAAGWGDGGGLAVFASAMSIRDCLITNNVSVPSCEAQGLGISECTGVIEGCTLATYNGVPCYVLGIWSSDIQIERTIIAFSAGRAVECSYDSHVSWHCCDLYGNEGGDGICGSDLGGNFSADPLFCDAPNGDYTLDANSPCLPGNHPDGVDCGQIGARGEGCGSTPTKATTWGRIKSSFRDAKGSDAPPSLSRAPSPAR